MDEVKVRRRRFDGRSATGRAVGGPEFGQRGLQRALGPYGHFYFILKKDSFEAIDFQIAVNNNIGC